MLHNHRQLCGQCSSVILFQKALLKDVVERLQWMFVVYNPHFNYFTPMNVLQFRIEASDIAYLSGCKLDCSDERNQKFYQSSLIIFPPLPSPKFLIILDVWEAQWQTQCQMVFRWGLGSRSGLLIRYCIVFLGKMLDSFSASLHPGV